MTGIKPKPRVPLKPNHYMTLGVPPATPLEEIHEAFKALAVRYHPDKEGGDEERFRDITVAWGVIKNDRVRYNAELLLSGQNCAACQGRGLQWRFFAKREVECETCEGTGQRKERL